MMFFLLREPPSSASAAPREHVSDKPWPRAKQHLGALLACVFGLLWGAPLWASTDGQPAGDLIFDQPQILVLLALVAGTYLISYLLLGWLTRRFGLVIGVQYILLGIAIGPVFKILDAQTLAGFEPLLALAIGALGMLAGLEFNIRRLFAQQIRPLKIALLTSAATLLLVGGVPFFIMFNTSLGTDGAIWQWMPVLLTLSAISLVADPRHVAGLLSHFKTSEESATQLATQICWLCSVLAVLVFGVLFCLFNPGQLVVPENLAPLQWLIVHLAVGGIMGAICGALVQLRPDDEQLMTILLGTVVLTSGIAYTSTMSIVFVNFIAGFVIINMTEEAIRVQRKFVHLERPLYVFLLFFVGTHLIADVPLWVYLLIPGYLALRYAGRFVGVALYRPSNASYMPEPGLHRALWAPGSLSAAMILDFFNTFGDVPYATYAMTGLIVLLIFSEFIAYILARGWLIDISDASAQRRHRKGGL